MNNRYDIMTEKTFVDGVRVLHWYRNIYQREISATERSIVARTIDEILQAYSMQRELLSKYENIVFGQGDTNIERDELFRALNYDRMKYSKGYKDGMKAFAQRLKETAAEIHRKQRHDLMAVDMNDIGAHIDYLCDITLKESREKGV